MWKKFNLINCRKMQIKTTIRKVTKYQIVKKKKRKRIQGNSLCTAGGNVKWLKHFGKPFGIERFLLSCERCWILGLWRREFNLGPVMRLYCTELLCNKIFSSVQLHSCVWHFVTPWTAACQASLSITNSWSLLKLMSVESMMPSSHLILCHPLVLLPSILPSFRVFSNESVLHIGWPKYWSFSFSINFIKV